MQRLKRVWAALRWTIVAAVVGGGVWLLLELLLHAPSADDIPDDMSFTAWYGHWRAVLITFRIFIAFLLRFPPPPPPGARRNAGLVRALVISLFTPHFLIPR